MIMTMTMTRMIKLWSVQVLTLTLISSCCFLVPAVSAEKTVTIFIMAGDANIEGRGSVPELHDLATHKSTNTKSTNTNDTNTNDTSKNKNNDYQYAHLIDDHGQWAVRDDVYVVYEQDRSDGLKHGPLTVKGFGHTPNTFGPDVEFGHVMGNIMNRNKDHNNKDHNKDKDKDNKVVIIKAGWERRSLAKDFRPPSAAAATDDDTVTGFQFLRIVSTVQQTMDNLGSILGGDDDDDDGDYNNNDYTVSIEGLVWWHGYDDIQQGTADEYESNLQCFLRDIRIALELPWLPILVAELGGQGMAGTGTGTGTTGEDSNNNNDNNNNNVTAEELDFRAMQRRVVDLPEFNTTTRIVETARYCVNDGSDDGNNDGNNDGDGGVAVSVSDDYTHYNGRAPTFVRVGNLMAIYMSELAGLDRRAKNGEQIEADYEQMENNLRLHVMLFFGLAVAAFVVFVTVTRGPVTKASLKKAWKDTVVALQESEQDVIDYEDDNGNDNFSAEGGPSTEMAGGRAEENLVV